MENNELITPTTRDKARNIARNYYGGHCIFTGRDHFTIVKDGSSLDLCHLYPSGKNKWYGLRNVPCNMISAERFIHTGDHNTLDYINYFSQERPPHERLIFTLEHCLPEFRQRVVEAFELLSRLTDEIQSASG